MSLPLKAMIDELGLVPLAKAADVPPSTLWRWSQSGIRGRAADQEARANKIRQAAEQLRAAKGPDGERPAHGEAA